MEGSLPQDGPESVQAAILVAREALRSGRWSDALEAAQEADALGDAPYSAVIRAQALLGMGDSKEAEAHAARAVGLLPSEARAWTAYGYAVAQRGDSRRASELFWRAARLDPWRLSGWSTWWWESVAAHARLVFAVFVGSAIAAVTSVALGWLAVALLLTVLVAGMAAAVVVRARHRTGYAWAAAWFFGVVAVVVVGVYVLEVMTTR